VVEPVAGPDPVTEPVPDIPPGAYPPYIPGVTPFPGIPGLGDLDFSGLPGMGDIDMDRIIQEYQDRQNAGEPEPFDSFLPPPPQYGYDDSPAPEPPQSYCRCEMETYNVGDASIVYNGANGTSRFKHCLHLNQNLCTPPPPEPNGFFPGINPEDFEDFDFGETTGNPYGAILNNPFSIPFKGEINEAALQAIQSPGSKDFRAPRTPQAQAPAPVYTPPPSQIPMQGMMDDYDFGNPNLRNMRRFDPRR
jgi:hypothetical protein